MTERCFDRIIITQLMTLWFRIHERKDFRINHGVYTTTKAKLACLIISNDNNTNNDCPSPILALVPAWDRLFFYVTRRGIIYECSNSFLESDGLRAMYPPGLILRQVYPIKAVSLRIFMTVFLVSLSLRSMSRGRLRSLWP